MTPQEVRAGSQQTLQCAAHAGAEWVQNTAPDIRRTDDLLRERKIWKLPESFRMVDVPSDAKLQADTAPQSAVHSVTTAELDSESQ